MSSLGEELPKEIERVQELIKEYESVPNGHFAATLMKHDVKKAEVSTASGDIVGMLKSYQDLKGYEWFGWTLREMFKEESGWK